MKRASASERGYGSRWQAYRRVFLQRHPLCEHCRRKGRATAANEVDHIIPHRGDMTLFWASDNHQALCKPCHSSKTAQETGGFAMQGSARPEWLPKPNCKVELVCGPPGSGKSTLVEQRRQPGDVVVDLDLILSELSGAPLYHAPEPLLGRALYERNARLAALSREPSSRTAWAVIGSPSAAQRRWWADKLNAAQVHLVHADAAECKRRIMADDRRPAEAKARHCKAVDDWFAVEQGQRLLPLKKGCGLDGMPTDPMHPWNQSDAA